MQSKKTILKIIQAHDITIFSRSDYCLNCVSHYFNKFNIIVDVSLPYQKMMREFSTNAKFMVSTLLKFFSKADQALLTKKIGLFNRAKMDGNINTPRFLMSLPQQRYIRDIKMSLLFNIFWSLSIFSLIGFASMLIIPQ